MSTFKDLFQSILDSSKERIKSPIIGTYIISFVIYNWRTILFLIFSNASIEDKIIVINNEYCGLIQLIIPLVITVIYILLFPFINLKIEKILGKVNESRLEENHKVLISKLTKKAEIAAKERIVEAERAGTENIANLKSEIDTLRNEKQTLIDNYSIEKDEYKQQIDAISKRSELNSDKLGKAQTNLSEIEYKFNEIRNYLSRVYVERITLPEDELFKFTITTLTDREIEDLRSINEQNEKKTLSKFSELSLQLMKKSGVLKQNFEGGLSLTEKGLNIVSRIREK